MRVHVAAMVAGLVGCKGTDTSSKSAPVAQAAKPPASEPPLRALTRADVSSIGMLESLAGLRPFRSTIADIEARLGPFTAEFSIVMPEEGSRYNGATQQYDGITLSLHQDLDGSNTRLEAIDVTSGAHSTRMGVKVGSPRSLVLEKYREVLVDRSSEWDESDTPLTERRFLYAGTPNSLWFDIDDDGLVSSISFGRLDSSY